MACRHGAGDRDELSISGSVSSRRKETLVPTWTLETPKTTLSDTLSQTPTPERPYVRIFSNNVFP